jgi:ferredoxin
MYNGYERWPSNVEKCTAMRVGNKRGSSCGTCIKVCPWNKPFTPFHRLVMWTVRRLPIARRLAIRCDDLLGYGKPEPEYKWWFDLEDVEGKLRIPTGGREVDYYEAEKGGGSSREYFPLNKK